MVNQEQSRQGGPPPIALGIVAIGGGVIGQDYAQWMDVDPLVGAAIGAVVGAVLTGFLYRLYKDPDGKVRETCSKIGIAVGMLVGLYFAGEAGLEGLEVLICLGISGVVGGAVGQAAAAFISFAAFALLFVSQGPVGLVVRTFILGLNDG